MAQSKLKNLENRAAALEEKMAEWLKSQGPPKFKDWRIAVGRAKRTALAEEVDAEGRTIGEADRRKARS